MSTAAELWNHFATADTGEITHLCVVLGFVVMPFIQGAWAFIVDTLERVR